MAVCFVQFLNIAISGTEILLFHKIVWQHLYGVMGFLIVIIMHIYRGICQ